jgi:para-aminobenzoate synthetase
MARILLVDNLDSYTYNLARLCAQVTGIPPLVVLNSASLETIISQFSECSHIVISPGPGHPATPEDVGICAELVRHPPGPILGVCLGMQILAVEYGWTVDKTKDIPKHGVPVKIEHASTRLFEGIPQGFEAVRYNSLVAYQGIEDELEITAVDMQTKEIMGLRHKTKPIEAVQFHPESVCSQYGDRIIRNFLDLFPVQKQILYKEPRAIVDREHDNGHIRVHIQEFQEFIEPVEYCEQMINSQEHEHFCWLDSSLVSDKSRFSFVVDCNGPLFHTVEFWIKSREMITQNSRGRTSNYLAEGQTFFEKFKESIQENYLKESVEGMPFDFLGGYCGYFDYEMKEETNLYNDLDCRSQKQLKNVYPDSFFMFCDRVFVFDHISKKMWILCLYKSAEDLEIQINWMNEKSREISSFSTQTSSRKLEHNHDYNFKSTERDSYIDKVSKCQENILSGDSYELCLTNAMSLSKARDSFPLNESFALYKTLRNRNPAPYSCFIHCKRFQLAILSSSPERFIKIDSEQWAECKPIKGTLKRNLQESLMDNQLKETLRSSVKDRAENLMITDLILNDLSRTCELSSVHASKLMDIETFATVHHMVSTIRGKLAMDQEPIDCFRYCFPPGSMTGAPKKRSMDILHKIEEKPRGIYSGSIGYFSVNRSAEFNVVIRTIISTLQPAEGSRKGEMYHNMEIGCGGAITSLSDKVQEYEEMRLKSQSVLRALENYFSITKC